VLQRWSRREGDASVGVLQRRERAGKVIGPLLCVRTGSSMELCR
jgi:hypothetical protein